MRTFLVLYKKRKYFTKASPPQLEAVKKKFSLDMNISCVMQQTKIFHQGLPPSTGSCKEEIFFRWEHFLCYTRNENISPRPPTLNLHTFLHRMNCKYFITLV